MSAFESVDIKHTTDYHSIMTSFKAKNPDIIFISTYEEPTALAMQPRPRYRLQRQVHGHLRLGLKSEKIVGLDRIEGIACPRHVHTYYRKYPAQDKKRVCHRLYKSVSADSYKEDFAQPGVTAYDPTLMFARAMEIASNGSDAYAIRAACPKALEEGKLPLIFPNNDVLKNGLIVGSPELLLQVKGGGYTQVEEMKVQRNLLE